MVVIVPRDTSVYYNRGIILAVRISVIVIYGWQCKKSQAIRLCIKEVYLLRH
jgi:hypothetical protein